MKKLILTLSLLCSSFVIAQMDMGYLGEALRIKQQRYDYNKQRINSEIRSIESKIQEMNISDERKNIILYNFFDLIEKNLNGKVWDLSSNRQTDNIIDWLYNSANQIIKNTAKN